MDVAAANVPENKNKNWRCPCQGCKKARAHEREAIARMLLAAGFETASFLVELGGDKISSQK